MKILLLSGGIGKRLWPFSSKERPKQFIKFLDDHLNDSQSMIQRIYKQLISNDFKEIFISSTKKQIKMIYDQLNNDIPIIVEPEGKDTFGAVALACSYFYSKERLSTQEIIAVIPVDIYVESMFFKNLIKLEKIANEPDVDLVLVGVAPTNPSEKYGYIVPSDPITYGNIDGYFKINRFYEKPHFNIAKKLIEQNSFWNCGVFVFKIEYMLNFLEKYNFPIDYNELINNYNLIPNVSFDNMVVKKTKRSVMVPYNHTWSDIGTWDGFCGELTRNIVGKGIISNDSNNTHLINESSIPTVIQGLSNIVVAVSEDGILVADKISSQKLKDLNVDCFEDSKVKENPGFTCIFCGKSKKIVNNFKDKMVCQSCTESLCRKYSSDSAK
ncbi:sugar phosphate nucleotidyltransferase [Lederbergia ruris]|uniref:sugar phosphate nucleotidyltransferase n=1 Tax=Lederbergia ruris TaxID=217495 RepID=UPI0039A0C688